MLAAAKMAIAPNTVSDFKRSGSSNRIIVSPWPRVREPASDPTPTAEPPGGSRAHVSERLGKPTAGPTAFPHRIIGAAILRVDLGHRADQHVAERRLLFRDQPRIVRFG